LKYMMQDPLFRKNHHHELTFSLIYAFSERFMLPLSHDEVVHGKGPLIDRMPGDEHNRFAGLRLLFGYMWTHPGSNLLFMGGEFGQTSEWSIERGLEWWLTQYDYHKGVQSWIKDLNDFYTHTPALFEKQFEPDGFEWIDLADWQNSVITYIRKGKQSQDVVLVACNFTPVLRKNYRFGVPFAGQWRERLNSDAEKYGGRGAGNDGNILGEKVDCHGRPYSVEVTLPPLSVVVLEPVKQVEKKKKVVAATKQLSSKASEKI
jgi:1,4-alpha-glucan branching enzyme